MSDIILDNFQDPEVDSNRRRLEEGLRVLARLIAQDLVRKSTSALFTDNPGSMPDQGFVEEIDEDLP